MLLSILHVNVKIAMGLSILSAIPICIFVQNISFMEIFG
jgi:NhaC family Na+:H+ antiporter